jgi:putative FmdB family regulatory protein
MPLYEYQCEACDSRFEVIRKFSDRHVEICARCGKGPVRRLVSSPAIQFKGTGWYITDYAQKGKPAGDSSGADGAAAKSDTKEAGESKAPTTGSDSGSSTTDTKATPVPSSGGTK